MQTLLITGAIGYQAEGDIGGRSTRDCGSTTSADVGKKKNFSALVAQSQFVRDQSETNKIFQLSIQQFERVKVGKNEKNTAQIPCKKWAGFLDCVGTS